MTIHSGRPESALLRSFYLWSYCSVHDTWFEVENYTIAEQNLDGLAETTDAKYPLILMEFAGGIHTNQEVKAHQDQEKLDSMGKSASTTIFCSLFYGESAKTWYNAINS